MAGDMLNEAARLAQGSDPAAARPVIARLLARDPHDADALTLSGLVAQRTGDAAEAVAAFGQARDADPANPARIGNHAIALKQAGRFAEAIAAFEAALAIRPAAAVTLANLGSCLIAAERATEAERVLRQAVAAKPDHGEAWNSLGVALVRQRRAAEAIDAYRRALAIRPGHIEATLNLIDALIAAGDAEKAEPLSREMQRLHPANPRAANQLAGLLERSGEREAAIQIYREAFARGPINHPIGVNLATALIAAGRDAEALPVLDRLIAALPTVTTPLALRCAALDRLGQAEMRDALMAVDRFVSIHDIDAVMGFASIDIFNRALEAELRAHPSLTFEPAGLVTRGGRQSDELTNADTPAIAALAALARNALAERIVSIGSGDHAFLMARPERWSLTMWGTILSPGGAVDPHIHAPNWLSGVYYPTLPAATDDGEAGWFAIGALPDRLGGGGTIRTMAPRPGRMILFPSYLWHATLPFGGDAERISFAFDLVPEGIGRPHRLDR
ncbi:tetratricopeptide repeat protein [Sphingomonas sp. 1P06PA]|uniref:tetratricopeptide repeat protein n=1 Tax=Sphingomonas sp. 1P06PA TaxID=554121 RepID=UPI0039A4EB4F